jgi:hypothetical protein
MMTIRTNRTLRNATTPGRKEIVAVESRLATSSGRTIRQIVIFDNHAASLRLLASHLTPRPQNNFAYAVIAIVLVLAIGLS